ncbi:alpha amylase [Catenovulum agarivorans DS-2]|uniref:Alpha amylase n=1 Tax=Catenovulum agarivorans DS-2 TaxID=1328313 RepID=W7QJJ4_9ALTE|nr:pullulanase-type alpha-1,6-glucosidase [Catenovulum agarivorans]EWH09122.1 alpha amylase [Catenovulum agarivorans DS-2]
MNKPKTITQSFIYAVVLALSLTGCEQSKQIVTSTTTTKVEVNAAAHWLALNQLKVKVVEGTESLYLIKIDDYSLPIEQSVVKAMPSAIPLMSRADTTKGLYPHLKDFANFSVPITEIEAKHWLRDKSVVVQVDNNENILAINSVQTGFVIDDLYTRGPNDANEVSDLGAVVGADNVSFKLWAPLAKQVSLLLYNADKTPFSPVPVTLGFDYISGVWSAELDSSVVGKYYKYQITQYQPSEQDVVVTQATDPYSLSLSTDSLYSQVVDLSDENTMPKGWRSHLVPEVDAPEDLIIYESHIRDFSASDNTLSNPQFKGKYKAFLESDSASIRYLKSLRKAGLNVMHLLPTYDLGTINETPQQVIELDESVAELCRMFAEIHLCSRDEIQQQTIRQVFASMDPLSSDVQAVVEKIRGSDPYNWGYDPYHYTVPEGSYAINPEGSARIIEFREMVQALHGLGFRVIMDVVYNHTYQAGLNPKSVLDRIVPNYYHRLNPITGAIEQSTCCDNTASERVMMGKLMIDSLIVWAQDYKIDGFRFDLMGHQPKALILQAREAVRTVDPDTYFYGEGWNFGEVANNAQFVQAIQTELSGSEVGTFTDRMRDAVRGGAPFDGGEWIRRGQGLANGLYVLPNELQPEDKQEAEYLLSMNQARVGLAGNLANFKFKNEQGKWVTGAEVDYGGAPTGYARDPADTINYVSKHDNQTLWDNNQYRIPYDVATEDRVRMQLLALAYPLMGQGIPFIHMGSELLRSKSFLRDSYDYGDWFNAVDFTMQSNNYHVGLPPEVKDKDNWDVIRTLLKENQGRDLVKPADIQFSAQVFQEFLRIRSGNKLFRLTTEQQVMDKVTFHNTGPNALEGVIAMKISDFFGEPVLNKRQSLMVVFNHGADQIDLRYPSANLYQLHPVQKNGVDKRVQQAKALDGRFVVPGLSVAVFVTTDKD